MNEELIRIADYWLEHMTENVEEHIASDLEMLEYTPEQIESTIPQILDYIQDRWADVDI